LVLGLLSDLPRKNCWTIVEWAGEATPDGMQHLLGRAKWEADQVRDDLRDYVVEHLHDDQAVLVVDETGDVKKGTGTVGVQRQYTGTAGSIENAQVAVYLVYAGRRGHAAVDRELYVPRSWTSNPDRCRAGRLPSPPNRSRPPAWSPGSWTPATRPHGSRATRSTAATAAPMNSPTTAATRPHRCR
jgi:SRSO17 transposase